MKVNIYDMMDLQDGLEQSAIQANMMEQEVEKLAIKKLGADAMPNEIESFKETYYKQKQETDYVLHNEFNMLQPKEGLEILEEN